MISLGIGDPDTPTYAADRRGGAAGGRRPEHAQLPQSNRGRAEFREAVAAFYERRFGVTLDPETEVMPAIGAKECIFNLSLAFLDPGDVALASDPGYPVYTGGPLMAGGEAVLHGAGARARLRPRPRRHRRRRAAPGAADVHQLPEQPDRRDRARRRCSSARSSSARANDILVVHDNAYSETTYDGYVAPSFLATPGAKEVGVEVFSLSKGYNMTGWRCAAIVGNAEAIAQYWRLKSNIDSGCFEAVQLAGVGRARSPRSTPRSRPMNAVYARRRDLVCEALAAGRRRRHAAQGHDLHLGAGAARASPTAAAYCEHVLEQAAVVISPGGAYGPNGEGFFRISLTTPDDRLLEAVQRLSRL